MNTRKLRHLTLITLSTAFVLTGYQNCAPAPMQGQESASIDGRVGVINPVTTAGAVAFVEKAVAVAPQAQSVLLDGMCRQDQIGAILHWELRSREGDVLTDGLANCTEEGFQVEIAPMQALDCESSYAVVAQLGVSESEPLEISRRCQ
jgi:hypothetical protein